MFDHIGNKVFLHHHAQSFPAHILQNAYSGEKSLFKRTVRLASGSHSDRKANIGSSHVVYRIKLDKKNGFKVKALIAPQAYEDSPKYGLGSDFSTSAPIKVKFLVSIATIT